MNEDGVKELAKKKSVDNSDSISNVSMSDCCVICYTNKPDTVVEPCGHGALCQECMFTLIKKERKCPMCREMMDTIYIVKKSKESNIVKLDKEIALSFDQY